MQNKNISKLNFIIRIFKSMLSKKNLIVFIGTKGVLLSAFNNNKLQNSIFIEAENQNNLDKYKKFFKLYKKYQIIFLLDTHNSELKHEIIPAFKSILKTNPIDKCINEHYSKEDIITYNIYNINTINDETIETTIALSPYEAPLNKLLDYVIINSFNFKGIYFLSLEFETLINLLIDKSNNHEDQESLQIFVTITKTSQIKIVVKHDKNIIDIITVEYPEGKSDLYLQGAIEQSINDKLIEFKDYIRSLELKVCIIILCNENLKSLFKNIIFSPHKIIIILGEELNNKVVEEKNFQDNYILALLNQHFHYLAFNNSLKSIMTLSLTNLIVFKPLIALIIGLLLTLAALKYQSLSFQAETTELNTKYYLLSEEYRDIKKKYPSLKNITNLTDLYYFESLINMNFPTPFNDLKKIFSLTHKNIEITNLEWKLEDKNFSSNDNFKISIIADFIYSSNVNNLLESTDILSGFTNHIKTIFQDYKVTYSRDSENIITLPQKTIIPAKITITGIIGDKKDAR